MMPRENTNLANQIGLCKIALVVDQVHRKMADHPYCAGPLCMMTGDHAEQRARLTYFWWVLLGGRRLQSGDLDLIPKDVRLAMTPAFFQDWLSVFHETATPIIGEELTQAWSAIVKRLVRVLSADDRDRFAELAKAS